MGKKYTHIGYFEGEKGIKPLVNMTPDEIFKESRKKKSSFYKVANGSVFTEDVLFSNKIYPTIFETTVDGKHLIEHPKFSEEAVFDENSFVDIYKISK